MTRAHCNISSSSPKTNQIKINNLFQWIYLIVIFLILIVSVVLTACYHKFTFLYSYLLCMLPSIIFFYVSFYYNCFIFYIKQPTKAIMFTIFFVFLKYAIFFIPIICYAFFVNVFDLWIIISMLTFVLSYVLVIKIIFSYHVKKQKNDI